MLTNKVMNELNNHTLLYNNSVFIPSREIIDNSNDKLVASKRTVLQLISEMACYGYIVDDDLKEKLYKTRSKYIKAMRNNLLQNLYSLKGGLRPLVPLFNNFPNDVPNQQEYFTMRVMSAFEHYFDIQIENRIKLSCGCNVNKNYFHINKFNKCPVCQRHCEELYSEDSVNDIVQTLKDNEKTAPIILTHSDENDVNNIIKSIVTTTTSVTNSSKQFLIDALCNTDLGTLINLSKETINFKEILTIVSFFIVKNEDLDISEKVSFLSNNVNSANDVYRVAKTVNQHDDFQSLFKNGSAYDMDQFYVFTENDFHLRKEFRFKFDNHTRKIIMGILDQINNPLEDMASNKEEWIRMAEQIHPTSKKLKNKYPKAASAFEKLRNNSKEVKSFNAVIDAYFEKLKKESTDINNVISIVENAFAKTYTKRPGVMVRSMDRILRETNAAMKRVPNNDNSVDIIGLILDTLKGHYEDITYRALISARDHFSKRKDHADYRIFSPAKSSRKFITENDLEPLDHNICDRAIECFEDMIFLKIRDTNESNHIEEYIKTLDSDNIVDENINNVYIDPSLYNEKMPIYLRSAKESIYLMETYSSINIDPQYNVIRPFTYWNENMDASGVEKENSDNRVDIDLSIKAFNLDPNTTCMDRFDTCSYMDLESDHIGMLHSGDIQEGPGAEFIDIDINSAIKNGYKHAIGFINSYTGQSFDNYYCFAGVMFRKYVDDKKQTERYTKGKQFDINTVNHKFDITGEYNATIPFVFDFENRKMIVVNYNQSLKVFSNVETNKSSEELFLNHALINEKHNMSIGKYMELYLKAKGYNVVENVNKSVMTLDKNIVGHVNQFSENWM